MNAQLIANPLFDVNVLYDVAEKAVEAWETARKDSHGVGTTLLEQANTIQENNYNTYGLKISEYVVLETINYQAITMLLYQCLDAWAKQQALLQRLKRRPEATKAMFHTEVVKHLNNMVADFVLDQQWGAKKRASEARQQRDQTWKADNELATGMWNTLQSNQQQHHQQVMGLYGSVQNNITARETELHQHYQRMTGMFGTLQTEHQQHHEKVMGMYTFVESNLTAREAEFNQHYQHVTGLYGHVGSIAERNLQASEKVLGHAADAAKYMAEHAKETTPWRRAMRKFVIGLIIVAIIVAVLIGMGFAAYHVSQDVAAHHAVSLINTTHSLPGNPLTRPLSVFTGVL